MRSEKTITVVIILHNRHENIARMIEFYEVEEVDLILADSSHQKHQFSVEFKGRHIYTPGLTYTQKIEHILAHVTTPYVALCADDDFTLPSGLHHCVNFLESHPEYLSCQGQILRYYRSSISNKLRVGMLYKGDHTLDSDSCTGRLKKLFHPYKSLLYAVHRTDSLLNVFEGSGEFIKNLYLNEYLTSILPVVGGKHKDIPQLYQLREYYELSDDKTATNIDNLIFKPSDKDYGLFLEFVDTKLTMKQDQCSIGEIDNQLREYASVIHNSRSGKEPMYKRMTRFAIQINFIRSLIEDRRRSKDWDEVLENIDSNDVPEIRKIECILKKYSENSKWK